MTFRTRIKRCLPFVSPDEDGWKFRSKGSKKDPRLRDPNVYQPGEKMPPLKYRRPVAPEHKAHLESFNWGNAWRRRSDVSQYSPMGSRMPSRRSSRTTFGRRSIEGRNSIDRVESEGGKSSRGNDGIGVDSGFGGSISGATDRVDPLRENSDETTNIANVDVSNSQSNSLDAPQRLSADRRSTSMRSGSSRPPTSQPDTLFTPEELSAALTRSSLGSTKTVPVRCRNDTPADISTTNLEPLAAAAS